MPYVIWMLIAWFFMMVQAALLVRFPWHHIQVHLPLLMCVFLILKQGVIGSSLVALFLGTMLGLQTVAPVGLHELALLLSCLLVCFLSGSLSGKGIWFYGSMVFVAMLADKLVLCGLWWLRYQSLYASSWWSALLLPETVLTTVVSCCVYPWLVLLDKRLFQSSHEDLFWRRY